MIGTTDIGGVPMVQTSGGGYGGEGGWLGMLLVIALLGGGGGLWNRGGLDAGQGVTNDFLYSALNTNMGQGFSNNQGLLTYSNLERGHEEIERDILTQTNELTNALSTQTLEMCNGFAGVNNNITNLGYQTLIGQKDIQYTTQAGFAAMQANQDRCCCETNRNIDGVNFNMANNTSAIIQANNSNTQRILDWLSCNELKEANTKITEQAQLLSEARIVASMKPQAPIPSYTVPSPYAQYGCNTCSPCGY